VVGATKKAAAASAIPNLQREKGSRREGSFTKQVHRKTATPRAAKAQFGTPNNTVTLLDSQAPGKRYYPYSRGLRRRKGIICFSTLFFPDKTVWPGSLLPL